MSAKNILLCRRIVEERGMEVLVLDQTRPDVKMPVVKVIVPGLRHFRARFAPGRLYDVPVQMGWEERSLAEEELNPIPVFDLECFSGQLQGGIMSQALCAFLCR